MMKSNFDRLSEIARKESKIILGLMSGTSMDGLDLALCRLSGHGLETTFELLEFHTIPHTEEYKEKIRTVFARGDADILSTTFLHQFVAKVSAGRIMESLDQWELTPDQVDLIASHGQTVYHNPQAKPFDDLPPHTVTLQLGDGDYIAGQTGIVTVSDFRQKHIAAGGEGAPLALYGDLLLFTDREESRILLNIGGISNFTFLPALGVSGSPVCSDTGPGNTLMDAYMEHHFGQPYDRDGSLGRSGKFSPELLHSMKDDPFFKRPLPKTTGPELFNLQYLENHLKKTGQENLAKRDVMATLHAFTAQTLVDALRPFITSSTSIYVSGGGAHNSFLMELIHEGLPGVRVMGTDKLGMDPDAKEAIIFAILANECLFGQPDLYPDLGADTPRTSMGKVSFP